MDHVEILRLLRSEKFSIDNEKETQRDIEIFLQVMNVTYEREVKLSARDIIDFKVGTTGIEVKISGIRKKIYYQLERYCKHPEIENIILVTNRAMGLPELIGGKRTFIVNLGRAWL